MKIDVQLLPLSPDPRSLADCSVVVFDILRATSVIVHALSQGAREFIPVLSAEKAFERKRDFPPGTTLLGGEKDTRPIEGFDLGNSPREYTADKIKDKRVILSTTNGTRAFHLVASAKEVMVGSFFNIGAVADKCLTEDRDLLIFPSGDEGRFSLEDTVCGGMLIDWISGKKGKAVLLTDAAQAALILFKRFEKSPVEAFYLSHHGNKLLSLGRGDDLPYCAQINIISLVPVFSDGVIRVAE